MLRIAKSMLLVLWVVTLSESVVYGSEVSEWVTKLASATESDRVAAIKAIREAGDKVEKELMKSELQQAMEPQQLFILRKLIGEITMNRTSLKPIDSALLTPLGADKEKRVDGNADVLVCIDKKIIVMNAEFCTENGPIEFLVISTGSEKQHESVVMTKALPSTICSALLVCSYTYAGELGEEGKVNLPQDAGVMVSIEFDYVVPHANLKPNTEKPEVLSQDALVKIEKKTLRVPIEYFSWNAQTEKCMKRVPFAFTGSKFEKDTESKKMIFMADYERKVIAAKLDMYAILNTPLDMKDVDPQQQAGYSINRFTVPSRKTPCRIVFEPWSGGVLTEADLKDTGEKKGVGTPAVEVPTP